MKAYFPINYESSLRCDCRTFPTEFLQAVGSKMYDTEGRRYIDFLSVIGVLISLLDLHTKAQMRFLIRFNEVILKLLAMSYKTLFAGPTGANAIEAAIKFARKITGRTKIVACASAFHGVTLGSLALTASCEHRRAAGTSLHEVIRMSFEGFLMSGNELENNKRMLSFPGNGEEPPAAIIVETVQGNGLTCASRSWLQGIQKIAHSMKTLLIVDDIMAGCGRASTYFSFEKHGIDPDIICLPKSFSELGLSIIVLSRSDCDIRNIQSPILKEAMGILTESIDTTLDSLTTGRTDVAIHA